MGMLGYTLLTWVAMLMKCRHANSPVAIMMPRPKDERG